jgi:hypothetical protein
MGSQEHKEELSNLGQQLENLVTEVITNLKWSVT